MKSKYKLKLVVFYFAFVNILSSQIEIVGTYVLTLEGNDAGRMNLMVIKANSSFAIAEFPLGSVLIDYKIESFDSTSFIIQFEETYTYSKMVNKNGMWLEVKANGWAESPKDKYTRKSPEDTIRYELENFD